MYIFEIFGKNHVAEVICICNLLFHSIDLCVCSYYSGTGGEIRYGDATGNTFFFSFNDGFFVFGLLFFSVHFKIFLTYYFCEEWHLEFGWNRIECVDFF